MVFFERPLSLTFQILAGILLLIVVAPNVRKKREEAFQE
jgi:putative tricarboxylic transport membrane protein